MAEPSGWKWTGTHLYGDQVIFYDRCTTEDLKKVYGAYRYDPFHWTLVREDGTIESTGTSDDNDKVKVVRLIASIDRCIEIVDQVGSVESLIDSNNEASGYFSSSHLPYSLNTISGVATSDNLFEGCSNTDLLINNINNTSNTIWGYVEYWRNYQPEMPSTEQTVNIQWFIPSIEELKALYDARSYMMGITTSISRLTEDAFSSDQPFYIWSSSISGNEVKCLNWKNGEEEPVSMSDTTPRLILCRYL